MTARSGARRAPQGLQRAGRAMWRELRDLDFGPGERLLADQCCRCADDLERLGLALTAAELIDDAGRATPLLGELRAHRRTLAELLDALGLLGDDDRLEDST